MEAIPASVPVIKDARIWRETRVADEWLTPKNFSLLVLIFIVALFPGVLFGTQSFYFRDYGIFGYPLASYHRECFWRGELPLWNPLNNCGLPHLAQWNTLTLYPLSLIYLLLPLPWSLGLFCLLHLFVAALGMYFLAFAWTNSRLAAAVAGFGFAFNGLALNCLMWPNNIAGLALMPWVVWRVERGWNEGGRQLIVAALVGALQMLSGAPEIILFTWIILALLWLAKVASPGQVVRQTLLWRMPLMGSLVTALAAAQLFPFLDLFAHCERDQNFGTGTWTMPQWGWLNLLLPLFKCYASPSGPYFQPKQGWTSSYYPGIGILALALFSSRFAPNRRVALLWALTLSGLIFALGESGYIYSLLHKVVPLLGFMRFPIKFVLLPIFVLPLLAALGVACFTSRFTESPAEPGKAKRWTIGLVILLSSLIAAAVVYSWSRPFAGVSWRVIAENGAMRVACLLVVFVILFNLHNAEPKRGRAILQMALLVALGLDAWTHAPNQNPTVPPSLFQLRVVARELNLGATDGVPRAFMSRPTHDLLYKSMVSDPVKDFTGRRYGLFGNCNLLDDVATPDGFYSLYLPQQRELWSHLFFAESFPAPLGDFLGISRISTNVFDWQARPSALPFTTIGMKPVFAAASETLKGLLAPTFDPRHTVYLPVEARTAISVTNGAAAQILASSSSSAMISLKTRATEPALVVIAQSFYHRWQATVDGRPARIWRANHAFQTVEVPAGEHHLRLVYKDTPFISGAFLSGLSLLGCIPGLFVASRTKRAQGKVPTEPSGITNSI